MNTELAAIIGTTTSFIVFALAALWYVVPWLKARPLPDALIALAWLHVFRYIALQIHSAQRFGFAVSNTGRDGILYGDLAGAAIALAAIVALLFVHHVTFHLLVGCAKTPWHGTTAESHSNRGRPWLRLDGLGHRPRLCGRRLQHDRARG